MSRPTVVRVVIVSLLLLAAAAATAASAAAPVLLNDGTGAVPLTPNGTAAICILEPGPLGTSPYTFGTTDSYLYSLSWRLPRQNCAACTGPSALNVKRIRFRMRWASTPCTTTVAAQIVRVKGDPQCREPDFNQILCAPRFFTIIRAGADDYETIVLDLDEGCCVYEDGFVALTLLGMDNCQANGYTNGIVSTDVPCTDCDQYITATGPLSGPVWDWCETQGANGHSLWMQVEADCCGDVDTHRRSWGSVKTIYR